MTRVSDKMLPPVGTTSSSLSTGCCCCWWLWLCSGGRLDDDEEEDSRVSCSPLGGVLYLPIDDDDGDDVWKHCPATRTFFRT